MHLTELEEAWLPIVEDASRGTTLGMRYVGSGRGAPEWRYVSVQHVDVGPPSRFVAICHRTGTLKRFRVEGITLARLDPTTPYRAADPDELQALLQESVDGFHGEREPIDCTFVVRSPEARWVALNLPAGMRVDPHAPLRDGVRVRCRTAAVLRVARFVVGLGDAAIPETPELSACVSELAQGALKNAGATPTPLRAKGLRARR
jgi:hypothetical protein